LVLVNIILGHFFPPFGLLFTSVLIPIITVILCFNNHHLNYTFKAIIIYFFIALNDIGIKLFAGGIQDNEGQGFINLMLIVGVLLGFIYFLYSMFEDKATIILHKIISIVVFSALIVLHLNFFSWLGLGRSFIY